MANIEYLEGNGYYQTQYNQNYKWDVSYNKKMWYNSSIPSASDPNSDVEYVEYPTHRKRTHTQHSVYKEGGKWIGAARSFNLDFQMGIV